MGRHWAESYVGVLYGECDCAQLCVRVQKAQFNNQVALPTTRPTSLYSVSNMIDDLQDDFATKVSFPEEGDAVLMLGRGRLNHIGIACFINDQLHVLHAMRNVGMTVLHRVNALESVGLQIEGYYKWR